MPQNNTILIDKNNTKYYFINTKYLHTFFVKFNFLVLFTIHNTVRNEIFLF